jgi:hypothetical protein
MQPGHPLHAFLEALVTFQVISWAVGFEALMVYATRRFWQP